MGKALLKRIVIDPSIMAGKPVIKGTRIPVDLIVRLVGKGVAYDEILEDYPHITHEDIKAALLYAAEVVGNEEVFPLVQGEA